MLGDDRVCEQAGQRGEVPYKISARADRG